MLPQQSADAVALSALVNAVNHAAHGRYATALRIVEPYRESTRTPSVCALIASCYRQLGRHDLAAAFDATGLVTDVNDPVGRADCATGWVADAIGGVTDPAERLQVLAHRLERAQSVTDHAAGHGQSWRLHVRLEWVRAEAALATDGPTLAVVHADRAVVSSLLHGTQRHLAKSLLIQGVARMVSGDIVTAVASLERAAALADLAGLHPLRVPAHGVLSMLVDSDSALVHRMLATQAADLVAADLPAECADWRSRPDVEALTTG